MVFSNRRRGHSPGTITVKCLGQTILNARSRSSQGIPAKHDQYIWRAPRDIPGTLPSDRSVRFDVFTAADGIRRFVQCPEEGLAGYVARAFQYGHSVLARDRRFDRDQWCEYLVAKLAFDRLEHVQERITRTFKSAESLSIRNALRIFVGQADVLSEDLGQVEAGADRRWSIQKVLEAGRRAAIKDGLETPTNSDVVAYGLLEAALLNPLRLDDSEASSLIRMSLYDFSRSGSGVLDTDRDEVWVRFHDLIRQHLYEDRAEFKAWFMGGNSNLIKSIANRTGGSGGKLARPVVKRALHDLGWRGYGIVAECLEAFARAFAQALPQPLSPREQTYFEAMYYRQPYLGELPLVLLMDRRALIKPAILQLWENPGDERMIGALHQLLRYYTEMVPIRREADRIAKDLKSANLVMRELIVDTALVREVEMDDSKLDELYRHLIGLRGEKCPHCNATPYGRLVSDDFEEGLPFLLEVLCVEHGLINTLEILWEEIQSIRHLFVDQANYEKSALED